MYKRGKCWYSDFWYQGARYRKSHGQVSKTVASEKERVFRNDVASGKYQREKNRVTFEKFAKRYLEYARLNKKPKSALRNEVSIGQLKPHFSGKYIDEIHPLQLERFKKYRREQGRAASTINKDVVVLKNMMKKAVEWGLLQVNQLAEVRQLKENNEKMWVLTPKEERRLLEECGKRPQKRKYLQDLVMVAIHSGMREAEIFGLKKDRVDLETRSIMVTDTKNGHDRMVPVNDTLHDVLKRLLEDGSNPTGFVFCSHQEKPLTVLTNSFWTAVDKAGMWIRKEVPKTGDEIKKEREKNPDREVKPTRIVTEKRFRFHDCRHTFGSRIGMAGADLKTIMEIMGHRTERMALRYQHPTPMHKLAAVKALDPNKTPSESTTQESESGKNNVIPMANPA